MTNLRLLIKNDFNVLLGVLQGKKKRAKTSLAITFLIIGILSIFALYSLQAYSMFEGFRGLNLERLPLFHACLTTLSVMLIMGVMRVSGNAKFSDAELLLSLPIKRRDILIAKTLNKYFFDLFFAFMLLTPYIFFYQIYTTFSVAVSLCGLAAILFLPLLSIGISYIVDFIITHLFNRFKTAGILKSLFSVAIYLTIMAVLLTKSFMMGSVEFVSLEEFFADRPFANLLLDFLSFQNFLSGIWLLLIISAIFTLGMILFNFSFGKNVASYSAKNSTLNFENNTSVFKGLLKKEINYYFTTPAYVINTIIGPLFILGTGVILTFTGMEKLGAMLGMTVIPKEELIGLICIIFCSFTALTFTSCISISLEGKNLWILKTTPIDERLVFLTKASLNVFIVSPVLFLSSFILTLTFSLSLLDFFIICLIPVLLNLTLSFGGVLINLWLPKFDWNNETQVVKQSLSAMLTMVFGLLLAVIPVLLLFVAKISLFLTAIITACLYFFFLAFFITFLFTKGVKIFRKFNI